MPVAFALAALALASAGCAALEVPRETTSPGLPPAEPPEAEAQAIPEPEPEPEPAPEPAPAPEPEPVMDGNPRRLRVDALVEPQEACTRSPVNLTVSVRDGADRPVAGARIETHWEDEPKGFEATTNETGEAAIERTTASPRLDVLVPVEVEAFEGDRYGATAAFFTVSRC